MASHAPSIDTRRSPRRVFNRAIGLLRDGSYEVAQALQISEGGMAVVAPANMKVGARMVITLVIPGGDGLVLRAFVVSERAPVGKMRTYGIQFTTLDLHQRRMIRAYVSAKTQAEAEEEDD
jgi:c-di-GMP-binding flagellar brake protein YcgR